MTDDWHARRAEIDRQAGTRPKTATEIRAAVMLSHRPGACWCGALEHSRMGAWLHELDDRLKAGQRGLFA